MSDESGKNKNVKYIIYTVLALFVIVMVIIMLFGGSIGDAISRNNQYKSLPKYELSVEDQTSVANIDKIINEWFESNNKALPEIARQYVTKKFKFPGFTKTYKYYKGEIISLEEAVRMGIKIDPKKGEVVSVEKTKIEDNIFLNIKYYIRQDGFKDLGYETAVYLVKKDNCEYLVSGGEDSNSVSFLNLGKNAPVYIKIGKFGGGSGFGNELYVLDPNNKLKKVLAVGTWNTGGCNFEDIDNDGTAEVINTSRSFYPEELENILKKEKMWDAVGPQIYSLTIYKWQNDEFVKLGTYYSRKPQ